MNNLKLIFYTFKPISIEVSFSNNLFYQTFTCLSLFLFDNAKVQLMPKRNYIFIGIK